MEFAGFLEWLRRMGEAPCELVDLSEIEISHRPEHGPSRLPALAISLGMLPPDRISGDKLWELAEPLQPTTRGRYQYLWQQLRSENAPLRVTDGDNLVSGPISTFDTRLMSYVTNNWQKVAMVVGKTLASQMDDRLFQTGDIFLAARIDALVKSGCLELRGKTPLEM